MPIKKRKRILERLLKNSSGLIDIFSSLHTGLLLVDQELVIHWASEAFYQLFPGEEPAGRMCIEFLENNSSSCLECDVLEAISEGKTVVTEIYSTSRARWFRIVSQAVRGKKNRVVGLFQGIEDISEYKSTEEELQTEQSLMSDLMRTVPMAVIVYYKSGQISYANPAAEKLLHIRRDFSGFYRFSYPDTKFYEQDSPVSMDAGVYFRHLFELGKSVQGKEVAVLFHPQEEKKVFSLNISPLRNKYGEMNNLLIVFSNITEAALLREKQGQISKLESIGRLAGGVAHDFNNILMVTNGFTSLLEKRLDRHSPEYSYAREIRKAGEKAAGLTQQLLAFSRKQALQLEPLDLHSILNEASKMLKRLIGEDVKLSIETKPDTGAFYGDATQVLQIIMNLAANARDAMPEGGELSFEARDVEPEEIRYGPYQVIKPRNYVLLHVRDTGVGMVEETRQKIFEPFFTTKEVGKGTGLGMATIYGTVKQMNGYIFCESKLGEGTDFFIYFPRMNGSSLEQRTESSAVEASAQTPTADYCGTILLVEDDREVLKVLNSLISDIGCRVVGKSSAAEALSYVRENSDEIDLVITDLVMPEQSGIDLALGISEFSPRLKILFISGYCEIDSRQLQRLPNPWKFLNKPVASQQLTQQIREMLLS